MYCWLVHACPPAQGHLRVEVRGDRRGNSESNLKKRKTPGGHRQLSVAHHETYRSSHPTHSVMFVSTI